MPLDALDVVLEKQVRAAKRALVELADSTPEKWWTAFDLKKEARNGESSSTMGLALIELLKEGGLERGPDLRVRALRH